VQTKFRMSALRLLQSSMNLLLPSALQYIHEGICGVGAPVAGEGPSFTMGVEGPLNH